MQQLDKRYTVAILLEYIRKRLDDKIGDSVLVNNEKVN